MRCAKRPTMIRLKELSPYFGFPRGEHPGKRNAWLRLYRLRPSETSQNCSNSYSRGDVRDCFLIISSASLDAVAISRVQAPFTKRISSAPFGGESAFSHIFARKTETLPPPCATPSSQRSGMSSPCSGAGYETVVDLSKARSRQRWIIFVSLGCHCTNGEKAK